MTLVSLISYIDRNTLALLAPTILRDTGLSNEQYGFIVSGFSVAYMIGNPVWGSLLDRFGVRGGMLIAVGIWTAASSSHALAVGFLSFLCARIVLGFGEGATFPGGLRTASETLPPELRSRGIALAYSGGSLGAVLTPLIVTPVSLAFGWRGAFVFTGLVGIAWIALWLGTSRLIPAHQPAPVRRGDASVRLTNPGLWAYICLYALGALPLGFVIYASALYLGQVRHLNQAEVGAVLWIPPLGWEVGYFFWGWISDRFRPATGPHRGLIFLTLGVLSLGLAGAPYLAAVPLLMIAMFVAMFLAAGFVILSIAYATGVFGTGSSGLIAGTGAGSWSAGVAIIMPLIGRMFDAGNYNEAFLAAAVIPVVGSAGFLLFDRLERKRA